jgi:hypothetical protein
MLILQVVRGCGILMVDVDTAGGERLWKING